MDYYSQFPAPETEVRVLSVKQGISGNVRQLQAFDDIVRKIVGDSYSGSYTGWMIFGVKDLIEKAKRRLDLYKGGLEDRLYQSVLALTCVIKVQRAFRERAWSEGGELYNRLRENTLVGKKKLI